MSLLVSQRQAAFSLWELLIALAIGSVMMLTASAWQLRAFVQARQQQQVVVGLLAAAQDAPSPQQLVRGR